MPLYNKLTLKELRSVLKGRHLFTNGNKGNLVNRLERADTRRATYRKSSEMFGGKLPVSKKVGDQELDEFIQKAIADAHCNKERNMPPRSPSRDPIVVEDSSPAKDDAVMIDADAEVLFPNATVNATDPPSAPTGNMQQPLSKYPPSKPDSYAAALSSSPPSTVGTATTAASTVSSLKTPSYSSQSSIPDSLSGRILNSRPKRNTAIDGIANFVQFSVVPSREKDVTPEIHTYKGIVSIFG